MFTDMHTIHPEKKKGYLEIQHQVYKGLPHTGGKSEFEGQKVGDIITVLEDHSKKEIIMSDSLMERRTNEDFVRTAHGHVLIAGLGLGMIILAIQDDPEVTSITVVEISQDVYDLVMPNLKKHFNSKVKVIISDIHDFEPQMEYTCIYCDIWNTIDSSNYEEMVCLSIKFSTYVNINTGYINHWRFADVTKMWQIEENLILSSNLKNGTNITREDIFGKSKYHLT